MGTKHGAEHGVIADERGVIYVEQLLMVCLGLFLAGLLGFAGATLLAPRYQGIAASIYAGTP